MLAKVSSEVDYDNESIRNLFFPDLDDSHVNRDCKEHLMLLTKEAVGLLEDNRAASYDSLRNWLKEIHQRMSHAQEMVNLTEHDEEVNLIEAVLDRLSIHPDVEDINGILFFLPKVGNVAGHKIVLETNAMLCMIALTRLIENKESRCD